MRTQPTRRSITPPKPDDRQAAPPGAVIILGESNSTSAPDATLACDELAKELVNRNVPYERWPDGWLGTTKSAATLSKRPIFVRTFLDPSKSNVNDAARASVSRVEIGVQSWR